MLWYHKRKMTWGLVALHYMLVFTAFMMPYARVGQEYVLQEAQMEGIALSAAYASMLCVLYAAAMATRRKWLLFLGNTLVYLSILWVFSLHMGKALNTACACVGAALMMMAAAASLAKQKACVSGLSALALYAGRAYPACMAVAAFAIALLLGALESFFLGLVCAVTFWCTMCTAMLLAVSVRENKSGGRISEAYELRRCSRVGIGAPCVLLLLSLGPVMLPIIALSAAAYWASFSVFRRLYDEA